MKYGILTFLLIILAGQTGGKNILTSSIKQVQWVGVASYYSTKGCLGCSKNLIMANGDRLDDNKITIAVNFLPLNSLVEITNPKTKKNTIAKITDRGGFSKLGRIADMSLALKNYLGCSSLCLIEIRRK